MEFIYFEDSWNEEQQKPINNNHISTPTGSIDIFTQQKREYLSDYRFFE